MSGQNRDPSRRFVESSGFLVHQARSVDPCVSLEHGTIYLLSLQPLLVRSVLEIGTSQDAFTQVLRGDISSRRETLCKYLDTSAIRVLEGDRHMTQAVLRKYDKYFFTGGSYVGKMVYEVAARELTPAILELGGKVLVL